MNFSGSLEKGANGLCIVVANEGFPEGKMVDDKIIAIARILEGLITCHASLRGRFQTN